MLQPPRDFNLVFQGPRDSSPETLRKLKRTFVSDLRYSVEQTRRVFEQAPVTIEHGRSAKDLERIQAILMKAGGEAQILEMDSTEEEEGENSFEIEFDLSEPATALDPAEMFEASVDSEMDDSSAIEAEVNSLLSQLGAQAMVPLHDIPQQRGAAELPDSNNRLRELSDLDIPSPLSLDMDFMREEGAVGKDNLAFAAPALPGEESNGALQLSPLETEDATELSGLPKQQVSAVPEEKPTRGLLEDVTPLYAQSLADVSRGAKFSATSEILDELISGSIERTEGEVGSPKRKLLQNTSTSEDLLGRLRAGFQSDLSLAILVGLLVLSLGNWIFLFTADRRSPAQMEITLPSDLEMVVAEDEILDEEALRTFDVRGGATLAKADLRSRMTVTDRILSDISLVLTTVSPPEPTPEEIVHNIARAPWLKKIVAHEFEITHFSGGRFEAFGTARAFVEDSDIRRRLAVDISIKGVMSLPDRKIQAKVIVRRGDMPVDAPDTFTFSKSENGEFKLLLIQTLNLSAV